ncbi:MAG: TolC family protein [Prevotellaceae bacterium]|jgi:outer membrane protein TolC|nr:TolC family protein [Prevotellaceae bacterium]
MKKSIVIFMFCCFCASETACQIYNLDTCKAKAIENNFKIKNAETDIKIARQTKNEAFTKYFPHVEAIGFTFKANHHTLQKDLDFSAFAPIFPALANPVQIKLMEKGRTAGIMATQPVFAGGQIIHSNKLAKIGEEITVLKQELSTDEVDEITEKYFWQLVLLKEKMRTVSTLKEQLEQLYKDVEIALKAGIINRNELLKVELKQHELESEELKLNNGISIAKMLLGQHIGEMHDKFDIDIDSFPDTDIPSKFYIEANTAITQRAEYKLLDKNVAASKLNTKIESGKRLPAVGIGAGYVYHNFAEQTNTFGMLYATVRIPISDWWGKSYAVKRSKLKTQQAENERKNATELMIIEIQQIYNELTEAYEQIMLARKSISSATENLRLNTNYYKAGISTVTDVLDARSLLQKSKDQYAEAGYSYQIKLAKYKQATRQNK